MNFKNRIYYVKFHGFDKDPEPRIKYSFETQLRIIVKNRRLSKRLIDKYYMEEPILLENKYYARILSFQNNGLLNDFSFNSRINFVYPVYHIKNEINKPIFAIIEI